MQNSADTPDRYRSRTMRALVSSAQANLSESERTRRASIRKDYIAGVPTKNICADYKVSRAKLYDIIEDIPKRRDPVHSRDHAVSVLLTEYELEYINRERGHLSIPAYIRQRLFG
jgi:hypothetical protein